jgi:hypothetical protein
MLSFIRIFIFGLKLKTKISSRNYSKSVLKLDEIFCSLKYGPYSLTNSSMKIDDSQGPCRKNYPQLIWIITLGFKKNANFFGRKSAKIAGNSHHTIDPMNRLLMSRTLESCLR